MRVFEGFMKGINLGGWISQCGHNYNEEHYNTFITKKDIDLIASWGLDHVRLPVDYNVVQNDDGSFIESGFKHIDDCIKWCEANNMKVVLDLHKTCGYVFDDATYCDFFKERKLQEMFIRLWSEFARRYGSKKNVAFELLNEITDLSTAVPWNRIATETIAAIRPIAPTTKIIIGGVFNSSIYGLTLLRAPYDENIVFTFHSYSPMVFSHQSACWIKQMPKDFSTTYPLPASEMRAISKSIYGRDFDEDFKYLGDRILDAEFFKQLFAPALAVAKKHNVPLYCGEYGVINFADSASRLQWYKDFHAAIEFYNLPRAAWNYKSMLFGITDEPNKDIYEELIQNL